MMIERYILPLAGAVPRSGLAVDFLPTPGGPVIATPSPSQGTVGQVGYSLALSVSGGVPAIVWSKTSGTLPTGLTLNTSTGAITGNPSADGTFSNIVIRATDALGRYHEVTFAITIAVAPEITTTTLPDGTEGEAYSQQLASTGGVAPKTYSVASGSLGDLSLSSSGAITGTPSTATTLNFTARVTDANGVTDDQALSIVIASSIPTRPASTTMLIIADPDAALSLTGASINAFHEQIEALIDFTNEFGGTKWTRQTAVYDGKNAARTGGDYIGYSTPNTADGKLNKWIASVAGVAAAGCIVLVFYPTTVDDGSGWLSTRVNENVRLGMLNDGADKFRFQIRDVGGTLVGPAVACALNTLHYAICRWDGTHVYLSIDGGAETSVVQTVPGGCSNTDHRIEAFGDSGGGARARGDFLELSIIDPADVADMAAFLEYTYPTLA